MGKDLKQIIIDNTQWPFGKRKVQYQSVEDMPGIRDMQHRYQIMKFPSSFRDKTVLDIGCNLGVVCIDSAKRGAKRVVGLDYREETVSAAKAYAQNKNLPIQYRRFNVNDGLESLQKIENNQFDHVFALSIQNHVKDNCLWDIINYYCQHVCWFEGHANQDRKKLEKILHNNLQFHHIDFLGYTTDRNKRANFKLYGKF